MNEQDENRLETIRQQLREDDPPLSDMSTDDLLFVMRHYRKLNWRDKESYDDFENELRSRLPDGDKPLGSYRWSSRQMKAKDFAGLPPHELLELFENIAAENPELYGLTNTEYEMIQKVILYCLTVSAEDALKHFGYKQ